MAELAGTREETTEQRIVRHLRDVLRQRGFEGTELDAKVGEMMRAQPSFRLPTLDEIDGMVTAMRRDRA
jgi:hypothetical protein